MTALRPLTTTVGFFVLITVCILGLPKPSQAATTLNACQRILTSGDYVLGQNVSGTETCFSIRASNVTLDGNGKTINVSAGDAVEVAHYSGTAPTNVIVKNLTSADGVRTYGDAIRFVTFQNLTVSGITIFGSDDVTIKDNTIGEGGINLSDADNNWPSYRPIVTNNTVTGGSTNVKILVELVGGKYHPCPRLNATFTNNTITDTRNDPPPEATAAVRIRCATHTTFSNNTVRSTGTTIGLYMRDESDDGIYQNNSFQTNSQEVLRIASGNSDKTFPSRNIFQSNTFISTNGPATFIQGMGADNQFINNLFWSRTGGLIDGANGNLYNHNTFFVSGVGEKIHTFNYDHGPSDSWTNNIFSYAGASSVFGNDGFASDRYAAHHNLFHNRSGAVTILNYGSLASWKSGTGDDANSLEGNPQFVDASTGNFHLLSGSVARLAASDGTDIGYHPDEAAVVIPPVVTPSGTPTSSVALPTITILAPKIATTVAGRILVTTGTAHTTENGGGTSAVFRIDGVKLSTDPTSPYRAWLDTRPLRNGYHRIDVVLTTKNGRTATAYRGFYVKNPYSFAGGTTSGKQVVSGIVSFRPSYIYGAVGTVRVRLRRVNGQLLGSTTTSPYTIRWDSRRVKNGWYKLIMNVTDSKNRTIATPIWVRVRN